MGRSGLILGEESDVVVFVGVTGGASVVSVANDFTVCVKAC